MKLTNCFLGPTLPLGLFSWLLRYNFPLATPRFARGVKPMTPEEEERMNWLCKQIQTEKDQNKFSALVRELNELLAQKGFRLNDPPKSQSE